MNEIVKGLFAKTVEDAKRIAQTNLSTIAQYENEITRIRKGIEAEANNSVLSLSQQIAELQARKDKAVNDYIVSKTAEYAPRFEEYERVIAEQKETDAYKAYEEVVKTVNALTVGADE